MYKTSLKRRIIILILTAIGCAQALVIGVTLWQEVSRYARTKKDTLLADARVLAAAVSKPAAARDQATIYASLRAIGAIPQLTYVGVVDSADHVIAELGAAEILGSDLTVSDSDAPLPIGRLFTTRSIVLQVPITNAGLRVGHLVLISDARDLKGRLLATLRVSGAALACSMLIALIVAWRMQRAIIKPLEKLTGAMQSVAAEHDYALSLKSSGGVREVSILIDGFNSMLGEIRERDGRIARSYADLERQVSERTVDLRLARDAAESANAQKSDFLATMSHEIRTPMNGMLVMAELLAQAQLPARLHRYAEVVWRSGQGLLAIINDILDLSKIEAGKLELEKVPVNLAEVVSTVIDLFGEKARSKSLDLASKIATDVPLVVEADPVRLNQILGNLVNNALKFTESGGVVIDVARTSEGSDQVKFSISDTGIGIAQDKIGSVFGAFSQADQSTTRRYGGTGLGLAICRKLVQAMGAEIDLTSTLGQGSTFSFVVALPIIEENARRLAWTEDETRRVGISLAASLTAKAVAYYFAEAGYAVDMQPSEAPLVAFGEGGVILVDASRCSPDAVAETRRKGSRIVALLDRGADAPRELVADAVLSWPVSRRDVDELLKAIAEDRTEGIDVTPPPTREQFAGVHALVADDNEINREVASEALAQLRVTVDLVEDGAAAVRAAATTHYDVIFMDGSMPVLDGFTATRLIREAEREDAKPPMPIVALTAHVVGTSSTAWVDAGMNAMLAKPFTLDALAKCLSNVLDPNRVATADDKPIKLTAEEKPTDDLIDAATIGELQRLAESGRTDFVARVVRLYLDHAPRAATDIAEEVEKCQLDALAKAAHALKSMSLNIGARRVARLASEIEVGAKGSQLPNEAMLRSLNSAIEATCHHLATKVVPVDEPARVAS